MLYLDLSIQWHPMVVTHHSILHLEGHFFLKMSPWEFSSASDKMEFIPNDGYLYSTSYLLYPHPLRWNIPSCKNEGSYFADTWNKIFAGNNYNKKKFILWMENSWFWYSVRLNHIKFGGHDFNYLYCHRIQAQRHSGLVHRAPLRFP